MLITWATLALLVATVLCGGHVIVLLAIGAAVPILLLWGV